LNFFTLGAFVLSQFTHLTDRQTDEQTDGFTTAKPRCIPMQRGIQMQQSIL